MAAFFIILLIFILLYFIAIMPQLGKPHSLASLKGHFYAHRGLYNNESDTPENSLSAFRKAVSAGYGIELDIQLSKDNIPVVFHDFNLKRMCNIDKKIKDLTFQELRLLRLLSSGQAIPSLEEVLTLVGGKVPIIIEYKVELTNCSVCAISNELLKAYGGSYCIESFNPLALHWYRKHRPEIVRGQLSTNFYREGNHTLVPFCIQHLLLNFITKPSFIAYNCIDRATLSRLLCRNLYRSLAVAWTIRSPKELADNRNSFDLFIFEGFLP